MTSGRWDDGFVPDHIIWTNSFARMTGEELSVYYSDSLEDGNRRGLVQAPRATLAEMTILYRKHLHIRIQEDKIMQKVK